MGHTARRKLRLIIYIRVSTEREKMCSPKIQLKAALRYAERNDIEIVGEPIQDLDKTGRDFAERKIADLISRVRNGEADGILIYRINRWGREAEACMRYLKDLINEGGTLISTKEIIDMTTSSGRKAIRDAFSDAEYESDVIGDNWKAAHEDRWDAGLRHSGREIFGYRRCPKCRRRKDKERAYEWCESCEGILVRDDRTVENTEGETTRVSRAEALIEFYKRFVDGEPTSAIVIDLAQRGVRSLNGNVLDAQSWHRAADTGFAAGYIRRKSEKRRKTTKSHKPDDYDIWLKGEHKRLVSEELWTKYKKRRASRAKDQHYNQRSRAFSGLLKCCRMRDKNGIRTECRANMVAYTIGTLRAGSIRVNEPYFRCGEYSRTRQCPGLTVSEERVEAATLQWIEDNALGADSLDAKIKAAAERMQRKLSEAEDYERQLETLKSRKKRLMASFSDPDSGMTEDDYAETLKRLNSKIAETEQKLEAAKDAASVGAPPPPEYFRTLRKEWRRLSASRKRQMLSSVIDHYEIRPRSKGDRFNKISIVAVWDAT